MDKVKNFLIKIVVDVGGIVLCSLAVSTAPEFIPILKGLEMPMAVASGVWLYIPIKNGIQKLIDKYRK